MIRLMTRPLTHRALRAIAFLVFGAAAFAAVAPRSDLARTVARLERENVALEKEIELAGDKPFYLVLDPAVPDLALMLRGAELRRYPVLALSVGVPRVAFIRRGSDEVWQNVIFPDGRLDPPRPVDRLEVVPPAAVGAGPSAAPEAGEARPVVPPTPEEAYPVPLRYHIRFAKGPSIEIRPREADATSRWARVSTWWGARWRDTLAALAPPDDEIVRIRIALAPQDAYMLYRSLPPDTRLLVRAAAPEAGRGPVARNGG